MKFSWSWAFCRSSPPLAENSAKKYIIKATPLSRKPFVPPPDYNLRPVARHVYQTMQKFPHHVVLTQMGGFYELMFDNADRFGPLADLKVVQRKQPGLNGSDSLSMSGFPLQSLTKNLVRFVINHGLRVVILKQADDMNITLPEHERRPIWRIVTPGTITRDMIPESDSKTSPTHNDSIHGNPLMAVFFGKTSTDAVTNGMNTGSSTPLSEKWSSDIPIYVAWTDLMRGNVFFSQLSVADLATEISRVGAKEILIDKQQLIESGCDLASVENNLKGHCVTEVQFTTNNTPENVGSYHALFENIDKHELMFSMSNAAANEINALCGLLAYIDQCLGLCASSRAEVKFKCPESESATRMRMELRTRNGLELFSPMAARSQGRLDDRGSLFGLINRTCTQGGKWLLREWISAPLLTKKLIEQRHDQIEYFITNRNSLQDIRTLLLEDPDCHRHVHYIALRKPDISRLVNFSRRILVLDKLRKRLKEEIKISGDSSTSSLLANWVTLLDAHLPASVDAAVLIMKTFRLALDDREATEQDRFNPPLRREKRVRIEDPREFPHRFRLDLHKDLADEVARLEKAKTKFLFHFDRVVPRLVKFYKNVFSNARSVSFVWHPKHLYAIRIEGKSTVDDNENHDGEPSNELIEGIPLKVLNNISFVWRTRASAYIQDRHVIQLGAIREGIFKWEFELEEKALQSLADQILGQRRSLQKCLEVMAEIDVITNLSVLAIGRNLVRPTILENSGALELHGVRHLVAEEGNLLRGQNYIANDCILSADVSSNLPFMKTVSEALAPARMWVITGPNMGGKSTFLRQVAQLVILAQAGSFVPASRAIIGIVDRVYCRIGSTDDTFHGHSTFMVEMLETATILKNATNRSLTIIDEVGRGSTISDCVTIAHGTVKCLIEQNKCRTLFATHYANEIKSRLDAEGTATDRVEYYHTDLTVSKRLKKINFNYSLHPGLSSGSSGFDIAELAGFPKSALRIAKLFRTRKRKKENVVGGPN